MADGDLSDIEADDTRHDEVVYDFEELRSSGMLWLINASVFHPRGMALALLYEDGLDEPPTGWTLMSAGGGEPFCYEDSREIHGLFRQAEVTLSLVTA